MKYTLILAIILVISILFGVFQCQRKEKYMADSNRYENNYQQAYSGYNTVLRINKENVNKYHKDIKRLIENQGLKIKDVKTVDRIIYRSKYIPADTVYMLVNDYESFKFEYDTNCFLLEGIVFDSVLIFQTLQYKDSINTIYYKDKVKRNFFEWITFKKKQYNYFLRSSSKCGSDSMIVEKFDFVN